MSNPGKFIRDIYISLDKYKREIGSIVDCLLGKVINERKTDSEK